MQNSFADASHLQQTTIPSTYNNNNNVVALLTFADCAVLRSSLHHTHFNLIQLTEQKQKGKKLPANKIRREKIVSKFFNLNKSQKEEDKKLKDLEGKVHSLLN